MCLIIHYVDGEIFGFLEGNSIAKEKWLLTVTAPICFGFVFFGQEIVFAHVCICYSLKPLIIILCSTGNPYGKKMCPGLLGPGHWGMCTWSNQQLQVQTLCAPHYLFCLLLQIIMSRVARVAEINVSLFFKYCHSSFVLAQLWMAWWVDWSNSVREICSLLPAYLWGSTPLAEG